jgi:hypothetical protein
VINLPVISDDDEPHIPGPMIVDPVPPPGRILCPQCGVVFAATLGRHAPGDVGVCGHCSMIVIFQPNGHPRLPTFDEAVEAELDPRIRMLQKNFSKPLPE